MKSEVMKAQGPTHRAVYLLQWMLVLPILGYGSYQATLAVRASWQERSRGQAAGTNSAHRASRGKVRYSGDAGFLWAKGPLDPGDPSSEWFDMTGSPLPLDLFQYGIGRDAIAAIDHPIFVNPDDERLFRRWRRVVDDVGELLVIGYEHNGVVRAYPVVLLSRHELVNDVVGGKPVTVGW